MPVRFPYIAIASTRGDSSLAPLLPIELRFKEGEPVKAHGLLDSGATVNVLPYNLGLRLGAVWDAQTIRVTLAVVQELKRPVLTTKTLSPSQTSRFAW